mmetsp:Transcript_69944/g.198235  ORF Transcript_69944/g.198235 Transcript_69944/m.198235 type:complete len:261 (-) Transcript_69944:52-834(-)
MAALTDSLRAELDALLTETRHQAILETLETWRMDPGKPREGVLLLDRMARHGPSPQTYNWPDLDYPATLSELCGPLPPMAGGAPVDTKSFGRANAMLEPPSQAIWPTRRGAGVSRVHDQAADLDGYGSSSAQFGHWQEPVDIVPSTAALDLRLGGGRRARQSGASATVGLRGPGADAAAGATHGVVRTAGADKSLRVPTEDGQTRHHEAAAVPQLPFVENSEEPRSAVMAALDEFGPERRHQLLQQLERQLAGNAGRAAQ